MTSRSLTLVRHPGHQLMSASVRYARPSRYSRSKATRTAFAEPSSIVYRRRPQSAEAPTRRCCPSITGFVESENCAHPLEIALATERRAAFALLGEDAVEHELRRDRRVVETGQEQRRMPAHPRVPDHQVLDGRPLGVAEMERPGHVRRRLDDRERRQVRIGGRAGSVRRRRRPRQASARRPGPRPRSGRTPWAGPSRASASSWSVRSFDRAPAPRNNKPRSSSGRTGSWYHQLVRRRVPVARFVASSVARYRAPPARLASDLRAGRSCAARTVPRSLRGRSALLLSVVAVRRRV